MGRYFLLAAMLGIAPAPSAPEGVTTVIMTECNDQIYPTRQVLKTETKVLIIITSTCLNA